MERSPIDKKESQKRRKKSQEGNSYEEMDDEELELFHIVQEDLRLKSTVGWQNAVKSLNSALNHLERPESQLFLDYAFPKIVSIMLDQHSSKIGSFEKSCVTQVLSVSIPLIIAQLNAGKYYQVLPVLVMVFNKKKTFYKDLRTSAMIGSYWNKMPGAPEVRAQCIAVFCDLKGFHLLLSTLEQILQNRQEKDEIDAAVDTEDIRILLQALLEFRASVPDTICTKICVLIMTYFTKISDSVLKKESTDAVGAVLAIIRRLVDAGVVSSDSINTLWLEITQRYVESTSLPLRLFGLEQINQIVNCARASRAFPPRYLVRNAGTDCVNGVYNLKTDSSSATYVLRREETDQVFTLFCCTMKSGLKWWFISEADKVQPGSDQDIDYYQHQSQYEEYLPPTHNWVPTGKGEAPAPELIPESVQENGEEDQSRLDYILSTWVVQKKMIEEIFGDRIHREIVSRSALLVKFLAESNKLDTNCLDVIWQSCIQKDQTLVDEIHNLLISTVPFLSNELLLHLVESIHASLLSNLQQNESFPELILFLQRLATNSTGFLMERNVNVTTAILQLLWSIQMHCTIANIRLSRSLREFFQDGLRSEYGEPLRKTFLNECIDGIKKSCFQLSVPSGMTTPPTDDSEMESPSSSIAGSLESKEKDNSASKSLELLKFLIDSYRTDQAIIVEALNAEHGLVALLFDELAAFVARSTDKQSPTYRSDIGHRLELIHYIHVKSPNLELTISHINRLWNVLSSSPEEREFCLVFFSQTNVRGQQHQQSPGTSGGTISSAFNLEVCLYIFNELLCKQTDFKTLGTMGYKCFNTYFVGLNSQQKMLTGELADANRDNALNLMGLDALWRIAFEAPIEVSELATKELLRGYERFAEENSVVDAEKSVKDFLQRVFIQLSSVSDSSPELLKVVQQCSSLLTGLVTNTRKKQPFISHGMSGRGAYFSVKITVQRIPASSSGGVTTVSAGGQSATTSPESSIRTMRTTVYANQTLGLFRKQLEKLVNHPMQQTKIICAGSAFSGDQKTLADLQITEASELRILLFNSIVQRNSTSMDQDHTMANYSSDGSSRRHPGEVIASDAMYFEILFRVLDIVNGHSVHSLLWDFLKRIPTSVELLDRVSSIGHMENGDSDVNMHSPSETAENKGDWSTLLQNVSYHKAIYTLQIIDALLLPSDAAKVAFARDYLEQFICGGGFHEVLSYFIGASFHANSFNEGAAVALRIIKFCLFDSGQSKLYFSSSLTMDEEEAEYDVINHDSRFDPSQSKIVVAQSSYDQLVSKIAELVVSEYRRVGDNQDKKVASRILIDAVKTVESIVSIAPDSAEKYVSSLELQAIIVDIFMKIESDQVRDQWISSLQSVCTASTIAATIVFTQFISSLKRIEDIVVPCDQYSLMLRFLAKLEDTAELCKTLARDVVTKLRMGFSTKFLASNERSVEVLVGFLDFLRDVLVAHADIRGEIAGEIVDVVYEDCLFTLPSEDRRRRPLCVSLETRRPAFKLLATTISSNTSILHRLQGRLIRLFTRSDSLQFKWGQENNVDTRGSGEHVGLKNQGCSCYMNSFLQQLFMHPTLRQGLLAAKVSPRPIPQEPTKAEAEKAPERLVGCRVALECMGGRVYEANVVAYDPASGRHTLRYDECGEASFVLSEGRPGNENGRYAILPAELTGTEATLEVLRQVQRTFCYLRDSEMRYFNPKALIDSCKCLNLEFSVYQQNDASEFCDKLLDRLETGLKNTPQGTKCLQHALGGKLISQKLPKDCGHRYEREEPFIRLELQIRGKESIEESLAAFVEGEVMDGDNKVECELCATKKAAVRRTCFGQLPNFLILHLKRFDLDYTTFETVKLNNRCSFPMDLNMKPYTKAGIEELEASSNHRDDTSTDEDMGSDESSVPDEFMGVSDDNETSSPSSTTVGKNTPLSPSNGNVRSNKSDPDYEYRLKGILVHSGVAQGGHYYSFIYDHVSEKWFKYDDEDVTVFDPANIETECFGGVQRRSWHGSSNSMEMEVFSNALMLFYEKVVPIETEFSQELLDSEQQDVRCEYEAEVWKSNEVFLQNSYLFDVEFHEFLREMVQSKYIKDFQQQEPGSPSKFNETMVISSNGSSSLVPPSPMSLSRADEDVQIMLADIGIEFVLSVLLHSREKHGIARWITVLASKFARSKQICVHFFNLLATTKRIIWLRSFMFECPDSIARQSFVHLVARALTGYENHMKTLKEEQDVGVLRKFIEAIVEFLDQTSVMQQSHLEECFMLVRNCAEMSLVTRQILQELDMIPRLINFFLSDRSPNIIKEAFPSSRINLSPSRYASPDYQYLLEAIIAILGLPRRSTEPLLMESNAQYPHRVTLSEKAELALTEVFEDNQSGGAMGIDELKKYLRVSIGSSGNSPAVEQNARVILSKYGNSDTPPRVELDGFLMYYTDIAATSTKNVLQDLRAFGFGEDLQRHSRNLPLASTILDGLSDLSRTALLSEVFFEAALEEDAETVCDLLLRICVGDHASSLMFLRSLLRCMNNTETGWKGQPVVDVCALAVQQLLSYDFEYQQELIELTLANPILGLIPTAENREKIRQRYVNSNHVPLFVYRQIVILLDLQSKVSQVNVWLEAHRSTWEWMYEWLRLESLKPSLGGRLQVLFRESAKLETLCRLGEVLKIPYKEEERCYIVEGAGFEPVNGIYKSTPHIHDSCLTYACIKGDIEYILFRCCMPSKARRWYISYSPNKNLLGTMSDEDYYFVQSHIDDESPPEDGWKVWLKNEKALQPAPTVRLYSSTVGVVDGAGGLMGGIHSHDEAEDEFGDGVDGDADADADTVEYDDSEDEIRVSNERFQAVHLDNQEDGSGTDDFM